jgi:hypothetical protein
MIGRITARLAFSERQSRRYSSIRRAAACTPSA